MVSYAFTTDDDFSYSLCIGEPVKSSVKIFVVSFIFFGHNNTVTNEVLESVAAVSSGVTHLLPLVTTKMDIGDHFMLEPTLLCYKMIDRAFKSLWS